ncbi:hypothetical protein D3C86_1475050 [compost metagenome]
MHEGQAIAFELLQDEALAAEEAGAQALVEADADCRAVGGAEKGVFLADQAAAVLGQRDRHHGARIGRGKGDPRLAFAGVGEMRHEQRLAGEHALAGTPQLAQHAARRAIAHARLEAHALGHVIHHSGFGDHRLTGIEDDFHTLRRGAEDFVVELVAGHAQAPGGSGTAPRIASGLHRTAPLQARPWPR